MVGPLPPIRPVIVGFRRADHAEEALAWAAREAERRGTSLVVLHAADWPGMAGASETGLPPLEPGAQLEWGALEAAHEVTAAGVRLAGAAHPRLQVVDRTTPAGAIAALVEASSAAGLVVVGSRRRGAVASAVLGSVSMSVAAASQCPVAVVPRGTGSVVVDARHPVVVGTDGSPGSDAALVCAADLATGWDVGLTVVGCTGDVAADAAGAAGEAEQAVDHAVTVLAGTHRDLPVTGRVLEGRPEERLVVQSGSAGLLVIGSRGRGAVESLVLGSVANEVVPAARCPVVVVRAPRAQ